MAGPGTPRQGAVRVEEMAAGAWAGLVGTILGYPLDVVKSRMQVGNGQVAGGFGRTLVNVVTKEGVVGMYRGVGPPIAMMMLMNSTNFTMFAVAKDRFGGRASLVTGCHLNSRNEGSKCVSMTWPATSARPHPAPRTDWPAPTPP